jgi:hypothetical protein
MMKFKFAFSCLTFLQTAKRTHKFREILAAREASDGIYGMEASDMSIREERESHSLFANDIDSQRMHPGFGVIRVRATGK